MSTNDIDASFNPISLNHIFEDVDPLSEWLHEKENPLLDGENAVQLMRMMDIVVIEVKLGLLVSMEENMGLVPLVDISVIDQSLMEICFLNLGEIEVNLELHQKEKAKSILL
ncbi:hypothetical protein Gotur_016512 [Gossypium turneri]